MTVKAKRSILITTVFYGLYGVYSRMIGLSFGAFSQSWARNTIIMAITGSFLFLTHKWRPIQKQDLKWFLIWPLSGVGVMILLFIAFNHLPVATGYFLFYSTMIASGFLSGKIFFGERMNVVKMVAILLSFSGLILIYSLDVSAEQIPYVLMALISGFLLGLWNTLSKKMSDRYPNFQLVFIDGFVSFIFGVVGAICFKESIPGLSQVESWFWVFIFAVTSILATSLLIYGYKHLEAQIGSIIAPVEVVFATLFGFLFFKEVLPPTTLFGGLLIALAAILPNAVLLRTNH